ncbi:MAG: hypothetical protein LBO69_07330 [Ignavibacteria bacterium]|nr:hypothetical protein [Ignavibacteria bacterium]
MLKNKFSPTFFLTAVIIIGLAVSTSIFAKGGKFEAKVSYNKCDCGSKDCGGETRSEVWFSLRGDIVYTEVTDCQGVISKSGKKPKESNTDFDLADINAAEVSVVASSNNLAISTNMPIEVSIVDLSSGRFVSSSESSVVNQANINISHLSAGCTYMLVVTQNTEEFGKMMTSNHKFCKE